MALNASHPGGYYYVPFSAQFAQMTSVSEVLAKGIAFSRSSPAIEVDSAGLLTWAPNNLLTKSQDFSSTWQSGPNLTLLHGQTDPDGGLTATRLTTSGGSSYFYSGVPSSPIAKYITSFYIRRISGTGDVKLIPIDNADYETVAVTSSWQRFGSTAKTGIVSGFCGVSFPDGNVIEIAFAQAEAVTHQTSPRPYLATTTAPYYGPRLNHDPRTVVTNLLGYSLLNSTGWFLGSTTTRIANVADPKGGQTATRITTTGQYDGIGASTLPAATIGTVYNGSIWLRAVAGHGEIWITLSSGGQWLQTRKVTLTPEWTRYDCVSQPWDFTYSPSLEFFLQNRLGGSVTYEAWGAQVEADADTMHAYVPTNGASQTSAHNLIPYSQNTSTWAMDNFGAGYWPDISKTQNYTTAPDGTQTASRMTFTGLPSGNSLGISLQGLIKWLGSYVASIWLRSNTSANQIVRSQVAQYSGSVTPGSGPDWVVTPEWQRFEWTFNATAVGNLYLDMVLADGSKNPNPDLCVWGAQLEYGSTIAHEYVPTFGAPTALLAPEPLGLQVEPERTNACKYSNDFLNAAWGGYDKTANYALSPDGTMNATRWTGTTPTVLEQTNTSTLGSNQTHTFSIWLKSNTGSSQTVIIKLTQAGILDHYKEVTVTRRWTRFVFTQAFGAGGNGFYIGVQSTAAWDILLYGAQLEINADYATSYIPTGSSEVTRGADLVGTVPDSFQDWFNPNEGTFVVTTFGLIGSYARILGVPSIPHHFYGMTGNDGYEVYQPGAGASVASPNAPYRGVVKAAMSYDVDNVFGLSVDGSAASTAQRTSKPTVPGLLLLRDNSNVITYGHMKELTYYSVSKIPLLQALSA
jgi:hypothetical protein